VRDLDKAAADEDQLVVAVDAQADGARLHGRYQGDMPRQNAELTLGRGDDREIHRSGEEPSLRGDDLNLQFLSQTALAALRQALGLLQRLVDRAHHVESLLRQVVVLALEDLFEPPHCLLHRHVLALAAGEPLRDVEGLG